MNMVYLLGDLEAQGVPLCLLDQPNPLREEKEKEERMLSVGFHSMAYALPLTLTGQELVTASKWVIIWSEGKQQFMILNLSKTYRWIWAYKQEDTGDVTHTTEEHSRNGIVNSVVCMGHTETKHLKPKCLTPKSVPILFILFPP